jgi:hypothetical protein
MMINERNVSLPRHARSNAIITSAISSVCAREYATARAFLVIQSSLWSIELGEHARALARETIHEGAIAMVEKGGELGMLVRGAVEQPVAIELAELGKQQGMSVIRRSGTDVSGAVVAGALVDGAGAAVCIAPGPAPKYQIINMT